MRSQTSRRSFLGCSALGLAAACGTCRGLARGTRSFASMSMRSRGRDTKALPSRVIRLGACRLDSQSSVVGLEHVAWKPRRSKNGGRRQPGRREDDRTSPVGCGGVGFLEGNFGCYFGLEVGGL